VRLSTARLELRPFRHADAADLFAVYSHPEVYRHVPIGGWTDIDEAHQRIARDINMMESGDYVRLAVELSEDERVIGEVLLFNFVRDSRRCEIGYAFARDAWGAGYARESLPPLIDLAFGRIEMRRIEAEIDPRNVASAKVLERLGFSNEGMRRQRWILRGETSDSGMYGLLAADWHARKIS